MKVIITQKQLEQIRENASKKFSCEKCDHSWKIEKEDKHPYLCHMCGYDSAKEKHNYDELENFWKNYKKEEEVTEKWSEKYKKSINCSNPKGFSQRAHCQGRKKKLNESSAVEMTKPSGNELKFPECPEGQYWDFFEKKCVDIIGYWETPKIYKDTYSGMDDFFAKQQKDLFQKLKDTKISDETKIKPYFERAKKWWKDWLNDPITKEKHKKMFGLSDEELKTKFDNYLKVIDNAKIVMVSRYGEREDDFAYVSDAYMDSDLQGSDLGHIFQTEYDSLIQNGSNEITAWLGALGSTIVGGNDINDCRIFVPSPLIGSLGEYEQTFAHEIQHLLERRVGLLTSTETIATAFPSDLSGEDGIKIEDLTKSAEVLKKYENYVEEDEDEELKIPEDLKLDLKKGITDFTNLKGTKLDDKGNRLPNSVSITETRAKMMIKDLVDNIVRNPNKITYNCSYEEKTANLTEIRNKLKLKPGEKLDYNGIVLSFWNDGWVNGEQQIDELPVYRTLACWVLNNFTPDLKTLFENLDNFVMNKQKNETNPSQPTTNKNLDLAHVIRKNIKKVLKEEFKGEELFKEVIERDVNEYASNYEWCDGIEISVRETDWLIEKQKPVYEYKIKFKDYSRVSYKEQENLFDDIMFVHTMYFPVEENDIDCYMSVKSVFPNGVERAFPNIVYYDEIISEAIYSEDDLKKYGYDIKKVKQALQILSQVSETVGEFVPLKFKLYGYQLISTHFGIRLDLYIDVDKDDNVYDTMSNYWHDISNQLLEIFEMLGIRDEKYMRPSYDFKFNKRPLYNITTV
jgi:hypothetical protein